MTLYPDPFAVTLPRPADTDPSADAALHIRNLADATNTAISGASATVCVVDTGEVIADSAGRVIAASLASKITSLNGFIGGPVMIWDNRSHMVNGTSDILYIPTVCWDRENSGDNTRIRFGCFNAPTNNTNVGRYQRICGLAWGPKKVSAQQEPEPAAALPPGSLFPPGVTSPWSLPYPGTDDPQWDTATKIQAFANRASQVIGSGPIGVTIKIAQNVYNTNASGVFVQDFAGQLARVRGACAVGWDTAAQFVQSRIFGFYYPRDDQPTEWTKAQFMVCNNAAYGAAPNQWPNPLKNTGVGAMIVAWGDPPAGQVAAPPPRMVELPPVYL